MLVGDHVGSPVHVGDKEGAPSAGFLWEPQASLAVLHSPILK